MDFKTYYDSIKSKIEQATEYSLRTDLEILMNSLKPRKNIQIIQENKKTETQTFGKPDFRVTEDDLEIGYIETKPFQDELTIYVDTPQLKRYLNVIPNLLLTNYRDFYLFREGEIILDTTIITKENHTLQENNIEKIQIIISEFFEGQLQLIEKTEKLSVLLAKHAQYLHEELKEIWYDNQKNQFKEKLTGLYDLFCKTLIDDLTPNDFIDAYAQTVTYGLLLAALSADKKIDKYNFIEFIPKSLAIFDEIFGLLRISNIPTGIAWIIDKLLIILNNTDYAQVRKELAFSNQKTQNVEDPYIYFYENFLKAYNQEKRVEKGVYYTPNAVVRFIIKATKQVLINDFKKTGLDDDSICLLDFATGTGTFLLEAFKTALENIDKGQKNGFIRQNLLKNFFGFEYLIAPYTIAHLKLTKFLAEHGFQFEQEEDRVKVFLTDTLDDSSYQRNPLFPYISDEGEQASKVKTQKKVWIILGNPPYSNFSKNKKPFIQTLINDYKKGLKETKINLDDDYIKFVRFAQAKIEGAKYSYIKGNTHFTGKIESAGKGIVGIITNNSYLNGITHRQMRKSIYETFDKIYIINLHGNSIIGEQDKNIFDITVGVAITILVKLPKPLKEKEVYYFSTIDNDLNKREDKYFFLDSHDINTVPWKRLKPQEPYFWFVEKDLTHKEKYEKGWKITDIFNVYNSGVQTDRDTLFIDRQFDILKIRIKKLLDKSYDNTFIRKFNIKDSGSYKLLLKSNKSRFDEDNIYKYHYRPFDFRFIYYEKGLTSRPSYAVQYNFLNRENIGLVFPRFAKGLKSTYGFVINCIADRTVGGSHSGSETYIAPLYIYNANGDSDANGNGYLYKDEEKKDNFNKHFRLFLKENNLNDYTPEQVLGYIYAILFCPTYREKYFEFLKIDFPKIPFTKDLQLFDTLSNLGGELIAHHLLQQSYQRKEMPTFAIEGDNVVTDIKFDKDLQRLYINKTQYFENFSQQVWEYEIGGYQVFDKYLKARKNLPLSYNEINHLKKTYAALDKTIDLQEKIDILCAEWI